MRSARDRRNRSTAATYPLEDSDHELVLEDRRTCKERRLDDLELEERQLLLSEMPWLTFYKLR
ncbi:MAG: hypothetical protein ABFS22_11330 [Pseudomonadota bacterium]